MTDSVFTRLKELWEATTKGPWEGKTGDVVSPSGDVTIQMANYNTYQQDCEFIAFAHNNVPAMLAEVERLRDLYRETTLENIHGVPRLKAEIAILKYQWNEQAKDHVRCLLENTSLKAEVERLQSNFDNNKRCEHDPMNTCTVCATNRLLVCHEDNMAMRRNIAKLVDENTSLKARLDAAESVADGFNEAGKWLQEENVELRQRLEKAERALAILFKCLERFDDMPRIADAVEQTNQILGGGDEKL